MTTMTLATAEAAYDLTHLDHLDRQAALPVVDTIAAQGDVLIRRTTGTPATTPVPKAGVAVVRGESGGNTHLLVGDAFYDTRTASADALVVGVITVPTGGTALLSHPEHGGMVIAPGTYEARRQREQADELRLVAD